MFNHLINIQETPNAIALLIDPDKSDNGPILLTTLQKAHFANVDFIFIGGSTVTRSSFQKTVTFIKENSTLPLIIFPGSAQQISEKADALLYLSLLSGRNPDFLIGHHIESALELAAINLEIIPTGYLLIDGGTQSSVAYVSQTTPIPRENISIVRRTAIAGKLQGKKLLFLDAGSGAKFSVPTEMVQAIKDLGIPLIVGGGVKNIAQIEALHNAGASVVVIGNKIEEDVDFLLEIKEYRNEGMKE
jgi:putative glycerol-1-phosphate prenyltransferase